jgi:hypothetical protein
MEDWLSCILTYLYSRIRQLCHVDIYWQYMWCREGRGMFLEESKMLAISWAYGMRYIYYYYFKGNASRLILKSLVYELPNCRCIASRMTYLSVWRLLILINSLQEGDVEFIWFVCGPNELGLKRCIHTYSDDLISIYVHILCIFRRYRREQKIVFKTSKERKRDIIQEGDNLIPPWREWERAVSVRE